MNKHIELVKKWLAEPKSVTLKELEDAEADAWADYMTADWDAWADWSDRYVYWTASWAAAGAAKAVKAVKVADAAYWKNRAIRYVKEYEELTK